LPAGDGPDSLAVQIHEQPLGRIGTTPGSRIWWIWCCWFSLSRLRQSASVGH
jgi:hypothetical protein